MYSGVSGLQVHQAKMDVIGNNVANVNTVGYKGSNVTFQEVFSQTLKGAGAPQGGRGGTNPQQIGLGASVAAINVNHAKGSTQRTDNPDDVMIDGNGFFVVSNDENALNRFYTRAGNFSRDKQGYLVTPGGYKVLDKDMKPVRINMSDTKAGTATSGLEIKGNINKSDAPKTVGDAAQIVNVDIYDSLGGTHNLEIKLGEAISTPAGGTIDPDGTGPLTAGSYTYRAVQVGNALGSMTPAGLSNAGTGTNATDPKYAAFDSKGNFVGLYENITTGAAGELTGPGTAFTGTYTLQVAGAEDVTIPINNTMFTNLTQYDKDSDLNLQVTDGAAAGSLDSYTISANGEVIGTFTNGEREVLATIGLASFDNNAGLMKIGNNMFVDTPNSGAPRYGSPNTGSFGSLTPGALEMSNVDLSKEFTEMITTQRGFQSNSRIISTTDEMLQELVNLKR